MLTLAALAADPDRFQLIDDRGARDFAAAHVAGAGHIALAEIGTGASKLPAGKTAVTLCGKGGGRSAEGAEHFAESVARTRSGLRAARVASRRATPE